MYLLNRKFVFLLCIKINVLFLWLVLGNSNLVYGQTKPNLKENQKSNSNQKMSEKKVIFSAEAGKPIGPYSQAVRVGDIIYVSGQIGAKPEDGSIAGPNFEDEVKQVMANIGAILKVEGLGYDNILKSTIFVTDMNNFPKLNEIYGSYFTNGYFPARETVQVSKLPKNVQVEISVIVSAK